MGKLPWRCKSTSDDDSNELYLNWIRPVVAEFRHPQNFTRPYFYYAHGYVHVALMGTWLWRCTYTAQNSSNELDSDCIDSVVTELQRPPSLDWPVGQRAFHSPLFPSERAGDKCNRRKTNQNKADCTLLGKLCRYADCYHRCFQLKMGDKIDDNYSIPCEIQSDVCMV